MARYEKGRYSRYHNRNRLSVGGRQLAPNRTVVILTVCLLGLLSDSTLRVIGWLVILAVILTFALGGACGTAYCGIGQ